MNNPGTCDRCGKEVDVRYKHFRHSEGFDYIYEDSGSAIPKEYREECWLCYDCDWELMNGYPMCMDPVEIKMDREERDYEEDPINNPPPSWYRRA